MRDRATRDSLFEEYTNYRLNFFEVCLVVNRHRCRHSFWVCL